MLSFVYLGTTVNCDTDIMMEIEARLDAVNKCYFGLMKHLRSKLLCYKVNASFIKH